MNHIAITPKSDCTLAEQLFYDIQNAPDPAKLRALENIIASVADESVSAKELQDEADLRGASSTTSPALVKENGIEGIFNP